MNRERELNYRRHCFLLRAVQTNGCRNFLVEWLPGPGRAYRRA